MFGIKQEKEVVAPVIKKAVKKRKKVSKIRMRKPAFGSPEEVAAYYREEGERVKRYMKDFKRKQLEGFLHVAKTDLMKLATRKRKLEELHVDLDKHKDNIARKSKYIHIKKKKDESEQRILKEFAQKIRRLDREAKQLAMARSKILTQEKKLVQDMKEIARKVQSEINIDGIVGPKELERFEESKEAIIDRARHLLSDNENKVFADDRILRKLDDGVYKRIGELNDQLAQLKGARVDTLKKVHLLEITEGEASSKIAASEKKIKGLEMKYRKIASGE